MPLLKKQLDNFSPVGSGRNSSFEQEISEEPQNAPTGGGRNKMWSEFYRVYNQNIYRRIQGVKGATTLADFFHRKACESLAEIEEEPTNVKELEWDNLIILDACRHDLYEEVTGRKIDYRITEGSSSKEFVEATFSEGDWSDTSVVAANNFYLNFRENIEDFFELTGETVGQVFDETENLIETGWNGVNNTVLAHKVAQEAIRIQAKKPENQLIIHFIQPHTPFPFCKESSFSKNYEDAVKGNSSRSEAVEGYKQNLGYVLGIVEELAEELEGKTVVTSDHGELLGENYLYGHPPGCNAEILRKVPVEVYEE